MAVVTIYGGEPMRFEYDSPALLADLLNIGHRPADMPCGKQGRCGKCKVRAFGLLSPISDTERAALSEEEIALGYRLACRAMAVGDVEIYPEAKRQEQILTDFTLPESEHTKGEGYGIAIDIGTTTLAAYIYDMASGEVAAIRTMPNPQRAFGADVTNRLKASIEGQGETLKKAVTEAISELAGEYKAEIKTAVITGNTAMLYLLTGEKVESITYAPFKPSTLMGRYTDGGDAGLQEGTSVWLPHCISAYVGADITCGMVFGMTKSEFSRKPLMLADIGTNGEMALFTGDRILTCSTAAGPAFEGAGITCGMTASEGAISRVYVEKGKLCYDVIGGGRALGICGSGLVDAVAVLLDLGIVDDTGRLLMSGHSYTENMLEMGGQPAYRFPNSEILLTQGDVRALQLAKGAICGGMLTLVEEAGLACEDITALQIAGGFGSYIDPKSAARIGLIPKALAKKVSLLGNGAGAGASMMLIDERYRDIGKNLSEKCETVELSTSAVFFEKYVDCMAIGEME